MKKAIIDIDGVLNYYPQTFINYTNDMYNYSFKTLKEIKNELSYNLYNKIKEEYRESNYKHSALIREDSDKLIDFLKDNNYLIYIVTSRQLFKNNQLENTICWLKNNNIKYDYMYCSAKKDFTIFEKFGHVDVVIEDNVDNLKCIMKINKEAKYFNIINEENKNLECNCIRVNSMNEIIKELSK